MRKAGGSPAWPGILLGAVVCTAPLLIPYPGAWLRHVVDGWILRAGRLGYPAVCLVALALAVALTTRRLATRRARAFVVAFAVVLGASAVATLRARPAAAPGALLPSAWLALGLLLFSFARWREGPLALALQRWLATLAIAVAATVLLEAERLWHLAPRAPGGILGNRNFAGELIGFTTPFLLVTLRGRRAWLLVVCGAALTITRCRAGWIAAALALLIVVYFQGRQGGWQWRPAALMALGGLLGTILPTRLHWRGAHPYADTLGRLLQVGHGSGRLRIEQHRAALTLLGREHAWLLGFGAGRWRALGHSFSPSVAIDCVPHSDFLRLLFDGGLVALAALGVAYGLALAAAFALRRQEPVWLGSLAAFFAISLADVPLGRPESAWILAAIALATLERSPLPRCGAHLAAAGLKAPADPAHEAPLETRAPGGPSRTAPPSSPNPPAKTE